MTSGHGDGGPRPTGNPQVNNPPGLANIAYRAGDFASFRRALLAPLPGEQELVNWSPNAGDLGLQSLEWWAYLADILTFYNERIANGSYLGTAVAQPGPQNAAGLAALLGYLTTPAITATGFVAAIRSASGQGGPLALPAGLQIASTPTPNVPAQLFEVTDGRTFTGPSDAVIGLPADPALFRPAAAQTAEQAAEQRTVLLNGQVTVTSGDQFILLRRGWDGTTADWAVVTAQSAAAEKDPAGQANTRVTLSSADWRGLAAGPPRAVGYHLQRAPSTIALWTMPASPGGAPAGTGNTGTGNTGTGNTGQTLTVPLSTLARGLSPGDNVLFAGTAGTATAPRPVQLLAQVTSCTEQITQVQATGAPAPSGRSATPPSAYISHTTVTVRTAGADSDVAALRSVLGTPAQGGVVLRYGFRDVGTPVPTPAAALAQLPATVTIPADLRLPADGRVALLDANGTGLLVTAEAGGTPGTATLTPADGGQATLSPPLSAPVQLVADLVPVSQGTTVTAETLGDGNPAAAGQTFILQQSPLIYLPPPKPGDAPVSTLSVSVNGVPWSEVRTFSAQPPTAAVYLVSQQPDGTVQVRFGDGVNGSRLPLGAGNVTATYRYGSPAPPPPAGALATVLQPQPNLGSVRNPVGITPGTGPETAGETAATAPATVLLLPGATSPSPPLISLTDTERLVASISTLTRARAYWTWDPELRCPAITVYVASDTDTDTAAVVTAASALLPGGASRVPLRAAAARGVALAVDCRLLAAPGASADAVRAASASALTGPGGLFSPARTGIGQRVYRSEVEAALTGPGVAAVLSLGVRRPGLDRPAEPGTAPFPDLGFLDPGQDGYFSLAAADLTISVVTR